MKRLPPPLLLILLFILPTVIAVTEAECDAIVPDHDKTDRVCEAGFAECEVLPATDACCLPNSCIHLEGTGNPVCVGAGTTKNLDLGNTVALCTGGIWRSGEANPTDCAAFNNNPFPTTYVVRPGEEDICCGNDARENAQQCQPQDKSANGDCGAESTLTQCCPSSSCVDNNGNCKALDACHLFGLTGTKSFCSNAPEWRDPDEDENFCTDATCTDAEGQFVWDIGGETAPNSCCGDDPSEFVRTCSAPSANGACGSDTNACCTDAGSCVDSNGACATRGECSVFGTTNQQSFCDNGVWKDPDESVQTCEQTSCTNQQQGQQDNQGIFKFGIGGTEGDNTCCGDDPGEFVKTCIDETDNGNCGADAISCCGPTDCVDSTGACQASGACSVFGSDSKKSFCDEGTWRDPDDDTDFCTDLSCSNTQTPLSYNIPAGSGTCCGDDADENLLNRDCASAGVCPTSTQDQGCCPQQDNCVFNGVCSPTQSLTDVDGDGDKEICNAGTWEDADQSVVNCALANNEPAPTEFLLPDSGKNPICGLGECDDANKNKAQFCCGDDEFEFFDQDTRACIKTTTPRGNTTLDCLDERGYFSEGEFFEDDICEAGRFTSRTRALATLLLDIANKTSPRNFSLFCDSQTNTLNYLDYLIQNQALGQDLTAAEYLSGIIPFSGTKSCQTNKGGTLFETPCVNNVCVLQLEANNKQQVIFATSLNRQLDQGTFPFIQTLEGVNSCDNAIGETDGKFHRCIATSSKAYYNDVTQSVVYTDTELTSLPQQFEINLLERFLTFLKNPHINILSFVKTNQLTSDNIGLRDYSFIDQAVQFSRIYLERKGFKRVRGLSEKIPESNKEYMSIEYRGFDQNICETLAPVDEQARSEEGIFNRILCDYTIENDVYQVFTNSSLGISLWEELTAGLRTQDTGCSINTRPAFELTVPAIVALAIPTTFAAEIEVCLNPYKITWEFFDVASGNLEQKTPLVEVSDSKSRTTQTFLTLGQKRAKLIIEDAAGTRIIQEQVFEVLGSPLCEVKDACGEREECILGLSSDHDAAASLSCSSDFTKKVCCPNYYSRDSACTQGTALKVTLEADGQTDNEGAASDLPTPLCVASNFNTARCTLRDATQTGENINDQTGCLIDETCIVKTSDSNNAHFSSCERTEFENSLCCSVGCSSLSEPGVDLAILGTGPFATQPTTARAAVDACNGLSYTFEWKLFDETNTEREVFTGASTDTLIEQEFKFQDSGTHTIQITITDSDGKQAATTQTFLVLPTPACSVRENQCLATENCLFSMAQKEDSHVSRACVSDFAYKACCPTSLEIDGDCTTNSQTILSLDKVVDSHVWALDNQPIQTKLCLKTDLGALSCTVRDAFNPEAGAQEHGCRTNEMCIARLEKEDDSHVAACVNPINSLFPNSICCSVR